MPKESSNANDPYAVAVMKEDNVVGHVLRHISAACSLFIQKGGRVLCTVQASRRYSADLPQGGLEVPCTLRFSGAEKIVTKLRRLLALHKDNKHVTAEVVQPTKKRKIDVILLKSPTLQVIACQYHGSLGVKWSCPSQIKKSSPLKAF